MQIHELPAGSPASGLQFAGDTGSQTQKIDYDALANAILSKLTTKTFDIKSESQTIIAALNALGDASKQGVANDLVTTAAGLVLDARQGKALDDKIASLNSSLNVKVGAVSLSQTQSSGASQLMVRQSGHVVSIYGWMSGLTFSTANQTTILGTISGVTKPSDYVRTLCSVGPNAYSVGTVSYLTITPTGEISVSTSNTGSGKAVYFNATYVV